MAIPPGRDRIDVSNDDEADFEYEVEPVDEHVVEQERLRAQEDLARAQAAIDIDAIYRGLDGGSTLDGALDKYRPRFTILNLLIATAVISVLLGALSLGLLKGSTFAGFIAVVLVLLGAAHGWFAYEEQRRHAELVARRERELHRARGLAESPDPEDDSPEPEFPTPLESLRAALRSRFRFSIREALIATAGAAALLALVNLLGSTGRAAAVMGALAVAGLAAQAADVAIPRLLVLGWWFSLFGFAILALTSIAFG